MVNWSNEILLGNRFCFTILLTISLLEVFFKYFSSFELQWIVLSWNCNGGTLSYNIDARYIFSIPALVTLPHPTPPTTLDYPHYIESVSHQTIVSVNMNTFTNYYKDCKIWRWKCTYLDIIVNIMQKHFWLQSGEDLVSSLQHQNYPHYIKS